MSRGQYQEPDQAQRTNERRRLSNKSVRSELRTRTRTPSSPPIGAENSVEALRLAVKAHRQGRGKGVIHKNQAANRKSRLIGDRRIRGASAE